MKKKELDWFFWGPLSGGLLVAMVGYFTIAEKVSEGVYKAEQSPFSFFLAGLLLDCYLLIIYGNLREDLKKSIKKLDFIVLLIAVPWLVSGLYFIIH